MVDYNYYIREYNGQKIQSEKLFSSLEKISEKYVMKATDNRGTINEIGEAICAVCDILYDVSGSEGVKSESIDGVNVSYENSRTKILIHNTLKLFLPSRLLYRGI